MYNTYENGTYNFRYSEAARKDYRFEVVIDPGNYDNLLKIAHENGILTFDVSTVINFVIEQYSRKNR